MKNIEMRRPDRSDSGRMIVIAGPCSVSDETAELVLQEARARQALPLNELEMINRVPLWKPRTEQHAWRGWVQCDPHGALSFMERGAALHGLAVAMEIGSVEHQVFLEHLTMAWLGARNIGNAALRQLVMGNPGLPFGIKNGMDEDTSEAVSVVETLREGRKKWVGEGAARLFLVHRGGVSNTPQKWEDSVRHALDLVAVANNRPHRMDDQPIGLIIDTAHGGEMAHDPNGGFAKSVCGQIRAVEHVIDMMSQGKLDGSPFCGVMMETSDADQLPDLPAHHRTDPNIPFMTGLEIIKELAGEWGRMRRERSAS